MNVRGTSRPGRTTAAAMFTLLFCTAAAQAQQVVPAPTLNAPNTSQDLNGARAAEPPATLAVTGAVFGTTANGTIAGVHGDNTATATSPAVGVQGTTQSTASSVAAILGVVVPTSPGGFSAAVRGINNGTGGLGIGVWGSQAGSGWGVYGFTPNGLGVYGNSNAGYGVYGNSTGAVGVYGITSSATGAGVYATNLATGVGTALEVSGAIKVSGTNKAAFQHTATPANIFSNYTTIDNPVTNGDPNAILIVTPVLLDPSNQYVDFPIGVWYSSGTAKWTIFNQSSSGGIPANAAFNVLVIKQ